MSRKGLPRLVREGPEDGRQVESRVLFDEHLREGSWKGPGRVLEGPGRVWKVLEGSWKGPGRVLEGSWRRCASSLPVRTRWRGTAGGGAHGVRLRWLQRLEWLQRLLQWRRECARGAFLRRAD